MILNPSHIRFKAARSRGPGGQRANRRETKAQIWAKVGDLPLDDHQKKLVREKLAHRINHNDELEVECEEERFQEMNHERALKIMNDLIEEAIKEPAPRIQDKNF